MTVLAVAVWLVLGSGHRSAAPVDPPTPGEIARAKPRSADERVVSDAARRQALSRARVWPRSRSALEPPSFRVATLDDVSCRFLVTRVGGTTPKFDCALDDGETLRVKYGNASEIPSEAAATRLVRALGFPADTITLVKRLRCHGCPAEPFTTLKTVAAAHGGSLLARAIDYGRYHDLSSTLGS